MLKGRHLRCAHREAGCQDDGVLAILNHRNDTLGLGARGIAHSVILGSVFRILDPAARIWVDEEAADSWNLPALEALVKSRKAGGGSIVEAEKAFLSVFHPDAPDIRRPIPHGPLKYGLDLEPATLTLLVIRRDAL